jgi:hypothetical protein
VAAVVAVIGGGQLVSWRARSARGVGRDRRRRQMVLVAAWPEDARRPEGRRYTPRPATWHSSNTLGPMPDIASSDNRAHAGRPLGWRSGDQAVLVS